MSKPWDKLRGSICAGQWKTEGHSNPIRVEVVQTDTRNRTADVRFKWGGEDFCRFMAHEARQVSEFLAELADQLEGK